MEPDGPRPVQSSMVHRFLPTGAAILLLAAVAVACSSGEQERAETPSAMTAAVRYVNPDDSLPRVRFGDGQVSLNDRCPVRRHKLNLRVPPVYVNGRPVGFC